MKKARIKAIGLAVLAVLVLTSLSSQKALSQQGAGGRLDGTWDVQLTPRNCSTGAPLAGPFAELSTFMSGGTMLNSTSAVPQAAKTPAHGVWSHVTGNSYRFKFKLFNFDALNNFAFNGWTIVTHELVLNSTADEYNSSGTAEIYNKDGVLQLPIRCSSTTAIRFE